ncbi:hypothetical protein [Maritimibacter sp. HL-12]|jgi:hypothetical protein|uniref:hypothetical protein n=1 Tax=Maritimibacter sp. HL-12 TaxID=1162418 RepID=UPI000A0F30FD|nr:hypothetical protein [Maritimibacter sp. HL-12]SMH48891.1 hypothetical protein SAMN05661107_2083 [Maritimibacter sp. HL-12]
MPNEWIIDILADLKAFAELNGMAATAAGLDDAMLVTLAELSSLEARGRSGEGALVRAGHEQKAGNVTHLFAGRGLA